MMKEVKQMKDQNVNVPVEESNEVIAIKEEIIQPSALAALITPTSFFFSSIKDDGSRESQIRIFNAINKADSKLDDHKGEVLEIKDVVAHPIELVDENTGELTECVRMVLIDKDGKGYESVSQGIFSSIKKLFVIIGQPSWEIPVKMKVIEQKTRKGFKTLTIELVI